MVGLLQHGFILHGLNPQISPKDPIAVLTSQNTNQINKDPPSDTPRHTQTASDTQIPSYIFKHSRRINPAHQYLWGETREEPSYHFSTILKCEILSCLVLLRQRNTKTAAYQLSKNDWVRPFSVSFRFVREKLFVTVAFDHPVACLNLPGCQMDMQTTRRHIEKCEYKSDSWPSCFQPH